MQEIQTQSWASRIFSAFFGILIGLVLLILAAIGIFWNESHGLHTSKALQQTQQQIIVLSQPLFDSKNNLKVIYFNGLATTNETLHDSLLNISHKAISLQRKVEMYQWQQEQETKNEKKLGGSEEKITTYTYSQIWSQRLIDSSVFKEKGHENPTTMPFRSLEQNAKKVTVGDFVLPKGLVNKITATTAFNLADYNADTLQTKTSLKVQHIDNILYLGEDPDNPQVGDLRIKVLEILPQPVSVIGQQTDHTVRAYVPPAGEEVELLVLGNTPPIEMIHHAESQNTTMTWLLRVCTLLMMIFGIYLILQPVVILADVIPFFGSIIAFGAGTLAFAIGLFIWGILTALAWFIIRPLFAIGLLVIVIAICYRIIARRKKRVVTNA